MLYQMPSFKDYRAVLADDATKYIIDKKKDIVFRLRSKVEISAMRNLPKLADGLETVAGAFQLLSGLARMTNEAIRSNPVQVQHNREIIKDAKKKLVNPFDTFVYYPRK